MHLPDIAPIFFVLGKLRPSYDLTALTKDAENGYTKAPWFQKLSRARASPIG